MFQSCDVLCNRNLGLAFDDQRFGQGTGEILLDDVNCRGDETLLSNCQHRTWGEHNCVHSEDVSVMCVDNLSITGTPLRCIAVSKGHFFTSLIHQITDGLRGCVRIMF